MRSLTFLFYFAVTAFGFGSANASAEYLPNFIIVMTDDQGFGDLGVHGNDQIDTPNLDSFAKKSLWKERFYVKPLCAATWMATVSPERIWKRLGGRPESKKEAAF